MSLQERSVSCPQPDVAEHVALDKYLPFFEPQFPCLQRGVGNSAPSPLPGMLRSGAFCNG